MAQIHEELPFTPEQAASACDGALHPMAVKGIELFNHHEFFEAHEALELAWRDETGPIRHLYRGILQVGVAYYHIQHLNYSGARKLFVRCRQWLDPFPDACRGVDVSQLRADFQIAEQEVIRLGPENLNRFNPALFKPVDIIIPSLY